LWWRRRGGGTTDLFLFRRNSIFSLQLFTSSFCDVSSAILLCFRYRIQPGFCFNLGFIPHAFKSLQKFCSFSDLEQKTNESRPKISNSMATLYTSAVAWFYFIVRTRHANFISHGDARRFNKVLLIIRITSVSLDFQQWIKLLCETKSLLIVRTLCWFTGYTCGQEKAYALSVSVWCKKLLCFVFMAHFVILKDMPVMLWIEILFISVPSLFLSPLFLILFHSLLSSRSIITKQISLKMVLELLKKSCRAD
jgi:hypothetical protein